MPEVEIHVPSSLLGHVPRAVVGDAAYVAVTSGLSEVLGDAAFAAVASGLSGLLENTNAAMRTTTIAASAPVTMCRRLGSGGRAAAAVRASGPTFGAAVSAADAVTASEASGR